MKIINKFTKHTQHKITKKIQKINKSIEIFAKNCYFLFCPFRHRCSLEDCFSCCYYVVVSTLLLVNLLENFIFAFAFMAISRYFTIFSSFCMNFLCLSSLAFCRALTSIFCIQQFVFE